MEKNKKQMKNKKIFLQILIVITSIIILVLSLITLASTVKANDNLAFGRYRFYIMRDQSQPEIAQTGDLVIAKRLDLGEINKGDKIVYRGDEYYFANEVVEVTSETLIIPGLCLLLTGVLLLIADRTVPGILPHDEIA